MRDRTQYKTRAQMAVMAQAGVVVSQALAAAKAAAVPGATTKEVDAAAHAVINAAGARSNFLGYHGFPAVTCISVNEEVVHGIPGGRVIAAGDVVSVDGGAIVDGWHGDSAITFIVGDALSEADVHLVEATRRAMWAGIAAVATGKRIGDISDAVEAVADEAGVHCLLGYVGHGIGTEMHQAPDVPNYRVGRSSPRLQHGMCLAIEPMFVIGTGESETLADEWTVVSADGSRSAHWEHSVALHEDGIWVLTSPDGGASELAEFGITPVAP